MSKNKKDQVVRKYKRHNVTEHKYRRHHPALSQKPGPKETKPKETEPEKENNK